MTARRERREPGGSVDLVGTGTFPRGPHRMADVAVRLRALLAIVILVTMSWGAIAVLGDHGCEGFSADETRALASLPVTPACIQAKLPPSAPVDQLQNNLNQLSSPFPGVSP